MPENTVEVGPSDVWVAIRERELALEESKHRVVTKLQVLAVVKDGPHRLEQAKELMEWIDG